VGCRVELIRLGNFFSPLRAAGGPDYTYGLSKDKKIPPRGEGSGYTSSMRKDKKLPRAEKCQGLSRSTRKDKRKFPPPRGEGQGGG